MKYKGQNTSEIRNIEDVPVQVSKSHYLKLSAIISLLLFSVGTTYSLVKFLEINPAEQSLKEAERQVTSITAEKQEIERELEKTSRSYRKVLEQLKQPVLIAPHDGATVIGDATTFVWDYSDQEEDTRYILELHEPSADGSTTSQINVIHPELKRSYQDNLSNSGPRQIIWRVRPGQIVEGHEVSTGPWSPSNRLTIFPSVISRIRTTKTLLVATTPTSYGPFTLADGQGSYKGFDIDLTRWIGEHLGSRLGINDPLKIRIIEIQWKDMFNFLQRGDFDIAVRSITRSKAREQEFPKIRFTTGYLPNHQILIQLTNRVGFPDYLKNTIVGAKKGSTNDFAARELAIQLGFIVDASYINYGDLYRALSEGKIEFAIVDYPLVAQLLAKGRFYAASPFLDEYLSKWYKKNFGYPIEDYAIPVHEPNGSNELVKEINGVLKMPETQMYIEQLKKTYGLNIIQ